MSDFFVALGLVLVLEGLAYAAFPSGLKRMMMQALAIPDSTLRAGGLAAAVAGLVLVWLIRV